MKDCLLPEIIKTPRLVLRPYGIDDRESVFAHAADSEWARFLPVPIPYLRTDAEKFLATQILLDRYVHPAWAIDLAGKLIGGINIRFNFTNRLGDMGYSIAKKEWGKGLATEAAIAVIRVAFQTHSDLNRIRAMTDARNIASQRVLKKIGMTKEGLLRQNRIIRGTPIDEIWFGILRSEWKTQTDSPQ